MVHFMDLPGDIRDSIYLFSLTVGADIAAHPTHYEKPTDFGAKGLNRSAFAVLRVNKRISEEAVIVIYDNNIWRCPVQ